MDDDKARSDTPKYNVATTLHRLETHFEFACQEENFWDFVEKFRDITDAHDISIASEDTIKQMLAAASDRAGFKKIPPYFLSLITSLAFCSLAFKKEDEHLMPEAWGAAIDASYWAGIVHGITRYNTFTEKELLSMIGKRAVRVQLANDPKQKAKAFILECWQVWQEEPERYKTKAAFAKAMLKQDQCKQLQSQKKIEDWCREWGKLT